MGWAQLVTLQLVSADAALCCPASRHPASRQAVTLVTLQPPPMAAAHHQLSAPSPLLQSQSPLQNQFHLIQFHVTFDYYLHSTTRVYPHGCPCPSNHRASNQPVLYVIHTTTTQRRFSAYPSSYMAMSTANPVFVSSCQHPAHTPFTSIY